MPFWKRDVSCFSLVYWIGDDFFFPLKGPHARSLIESHRKIHKRQNKEMEQLQNCNDTNVERFEEKTLLFVLGYWLS